MDVEAAVIKRRTKTDIPRREVQIELNNRKFQSWKQYCEVSSAINPWNEVYKLASGKHKKTTTLTTVRLPNGQLTTDTKSTLNAMLNHFVPSDNECSDNQHHRSIRQETKASIDTPDDNIFTANEVGNVIWQMKPSKTPGIDGITSNIIQRVYTILPEFITSLYNYCLRTGYFPHQWKKSLIIPIVKPGKEDCLDPSRFRPISLISVSGKILEKLMIVRIMTHIEAKSGLNKNQYGFTPGKGTVDAILSVQQFVEAELKLRNCVVVTSLDVKGAFDAAWWPSILKALMEFQCPKNLYKLTQNCFSERLAILESNQICASKPRLFLTY